MYLNLQLDPEASILAEKLTFTTDKYEITYEDIEGLKEKKFISFVKGDDLIYPIHCQVIVYCQGFREAKVILFNQEYDLPEEVYEEPLLNKQLIEWSQMNTGFWLEFDVPLEDEGIKLNLSYEY